MQLAVLRLEHITLLLPRGDFLDDELVDSTSLYDGFFLSVARQCHLAVWLKELVRPSWPLYGTFDGKGGLYRELLVCS